VTTDFLSCQIVGLISEQASNSKRKFSPPDDNEFLLNDYESEEDELDTIEQKYKKRKFFSFDDELDNDSSITTINENTDDNDVDVRKVHRFKRYNN
jgi:hypothetical protein